MKIKICGLTRASDAAVAEVAGAVYGGVILAGGSPRTVPVESVRAIFRATSLIPCGVFVNEPADRLLASAETAGLGVVQLHGDESPEVVAAIRARFAGEVWKAVRPRTGDDFVDAVARYAQVADGLLLDGWSATARGGTGTRFPWEEVARHRTRLDGSVALIVAGGLTSENVPEIIEVLAPDVVDVSSSVEISPGRKDPESIRRFAAAALAAVR